MFKVLSVPDEKEIEDAKLKRKEDMESRRCMGGSEALILATPAPLIIYTKLIKVGLAGITTGFVGMGIAFVIVYGVGG